MSFCSLLCVWHSKLNIYLLLLSKQAPKVAQGCRCHFEDPRKLDLIGQREGRVDVNEIPLEDLTKRGLGGEAFLLLSVMG